MDGGLIRSNQVMFKLLVRLSTHLEVFAKL